MKNKYFVRILSAIILLATIVAGILIIANYMKLERIRRSIESIMMNRPTLISYLTKDNMLMGFNGFDFWSNVKGILNGTKDDKTYEKGYLPIPLGSVPPIWEGIIVDSYVLDIDEKLVGVRMDLLSYNDVPYVKLMSAIIGKEPDIISKSDEIIWLFPNFTVSSAIIPVYPALFVSGIPPPGITIINNKAIGQEVNYTNTYMEPFVWITK